MKKISLLLMLAVILTMGGVYAAWNYAQGSVPPIPKALDGQTKITDKVVDSNSKGNISVDVSNLSIQIDDANNDHYAELTVSGYIDITFTANKGADASVVENGIALKYALSCSGLQYLEDHIFNFSTAEVVLNEGAPAKMVRIEADELGITLKNDIYLPTVEDYDEFYTALHTGTLMITVSEYIAP